MKHAFILIFGALAKSKDPRLALFCCGINESDSEPPREMWRKGCCNIRAMQLTWALQLLKPLWDYDLFYWYRSSKRDPQAAVKWCSLSSPARELPLAMFYLGMAYSTGDGIKINDDYSVRWIRAAADRGLVMAQLALGLKLCHGDGIEHNLTLGVTWLRQAATNGSAEAALQLRRFENMLVRSPPNDSTIKDSQQEPLSTLVQNSSLVQSDEQPSSVRTAKKGSTLIAPKESKDAVDMALEQLILCSNEKEAKKFSQKKWPKMEK